MFDVRGRTLHGIKWTAFNAFASRGVGFVLGIVLARLLSPSDYGTVGMAAIFFTLCGIVIDGGLCGALIRKQDATDEDKSTIFFFNIAVSAICASLICIFSSTIADFLHSPILKDIVKVSALSMFIGSFGSVQWTLCSKAVDFKTPGLIRLPVQITTGAIAVFLAYRGFGTWALVWQGLLSTILSTIAIWRVSKWRPILVFSLKSFKELFGFGGNLALNSVIDTFYNEGVGMIIGKYYSPSQLGYYSKGQGTAQLPSTFIFGVVGGVLFPVLSKIQNNDERLLSVYRRFMRMLSLIIFFSMFLMIALARPITVFLYSNRWMPAIVFMQIFGLRYMLYHIHALNWNLLMVKGRSDWALKKEIINKTFNFVLLAIAIKHGPVYIALAGFIASILNIFVNTLVAGWLFDFGFKKQCSDFMPYFIISFFAAIPAYLISMVAIYSLASIILGAIVSFVLYFGYLILKRDENLYELVKLLPFKSLTNFLQKGTKKGLINGAPSKAR